MERLRVPQPRQLTDDDRDPAADVGASDRALAGERARRLVRLEARCGEALDDDNVVGWSEHATDGKDVFDYSEPPPVGDFVSLRFPADGGSSTADAWTSDIRALPRDGQR